MVGKFSSARRTTSPVLTNRAALESCWVLRGVQGTVGGWEGVWPVGLLLKDILGDKELETASCVFSGRRRDGGLAPASMKRFFMSESTAGLTFIEPLECSGDREIMRGRSQALEITLVPEVPNQTALFKLMLYFNLKKQWPLGDVGKDWKWCSTCVWPLVVLQVNS